MSRTPSVPRHQGQTGQGIEDPVSPVVGSEIEAAEGAGAASQIQTKHAVDASIQPARWDERSRACGKPRRFKASHDADAEEDGPRDFDQRKTAFRLEVWRRCALPCDGRWGSARRYARLENNRKFNVNTILVSLLDSLGVHIEHTDWDADTIKRVEDSPGLRNVPLIEPGDRRFDRRGGGLSHASRTGTHPNTMAPCFDIGRLRKPSQ